MLTISCSDFYVYKQYAANPNYFKQNLWVKKIHHKSVVDCPLQQYFGLKSMHYPETWDVALGYMYT